MSTTAFTVLERENPPLRDAQAVQCKSELPQKAAELLGYTPLLDRKKQHELREALAELDIRPFTKESVELYKKQAEKNSKPTFVQRLVQIATIVCLSAAVISLGPTVFAWLELSWEVWACFAGAFLLSVVAIGFLSSLGKKYQLPQEYTWRVTPLKGYSQAVPLFVLKPAVQIKEKLPEAEFFVHELVQNEKAADPFLAVRAGGEECLIAVWNEPGFDSKKLA